MHYILQVCLGGKNLKINTIKKYLPFIVWFGVLLVLMIMN